MSDGPSGAADPKPVAYERITDAVFALDTDWRVTFLDERAERELGVSEEAALGTPVWEALPDFADAGFKNRCLDALESGDPVRFERPSPTADGRLSVWVYPSETGVSVCLREAVESGKRVDEQQQYRAVMDGITDAAVTINEEGVIRHANSATEDLFGYKPAELVGEPLTVLIPEGLCERRKAGLQRYLETGERRMDWRDIEMLGLRKDGSEVELSISYTASDKNDETRITCVIRDITERKRRERALRRAYEAISDNSLDFDRKVEALLEIGRDVTGMEYGTLSQVQGDRYLFDTVVAPPNADLESGDVVSLEATNCEEVVTTEETVVIPDIERDAPEMASRAGNAEWGIACYLGAPVDVDDEVYGTFCFYDMTPRAEELSEWQVAFVEYLSQWVGHELERRRYVDRLAALNELNQVTREITGAAIDQSTREEIERRVCEALAATDSYEFAWVGEANPHTQEVELRAEAGVEDYLEDVTISVDPEVAESGGPTGQALRTGELQTIQRVGQERTYEPWQDTAEEYGYRSSAAVPVVHEGTEYGVLNLYTDRLDAFEGEERSVVKLLGNIVGHAIAAADRKKALLADSVVELELRVDGAVEQSDVSEAPQNTVVMDAAIPRGDGEYVLFGTADPVDRSFIEALVDSANDWEELLDFTETAEEFSFEVLLDSPPLLSKLGSVGGRLLEAVIEDNDLRVRAELPHSADVRRTLDTLRESYPTTTLVTRQKTVASRSTDHGGEPAVFDELTDRQLESLRTAYRAGYFDWPRNASGEDVAEVLDISPATFSQHLRAAEQTVFSSLLDEAE
ncbi:MAG: PAS domain S-box protein [Halolamina sp.]